MPTIRLLEAEKIRKTVTAQEQRQIKRLYREAVGYAEDWAKSLENKTNVSSVIRREYLRQMTNELNGALKDIGKSTESIITQGIRTTATGVVNNVASMMLTTFKLDIGTAYSYIPRDVVRSIVTGQVYGGDWSLSRAIWGATKKSQSDVQSIVARGLVENKSAYDIAKDLEAYVNPAARKDWSWGKLYPGSNKVVDYSAQRLARTLTSHAYQQSLIQSTQDNPFFEGYEWMTSGHNVCPICLDYEAEDHTNGVLPPGVFFKDEVPLDHPNGFCTLGVYCERDTDAIVSKLANWANGVEESAELDKYAESLGYPLSELKNRVKK